MALVTLAVAKRHLYVTDSDHDEDIELKIEQASDIILSYLKGRQIAVTSITSTGTLATVTTPTPHGLTTSMIVAIRGAQQAQYNGSVTATVTSTTTFTYPITGTPASPATGGPAISATETWTTLTVPPLVRSMVLLLLANLWEHRGDDMANDERLWAALKNLGEIYGRAPALA